MGAGSQQPCPGPDATAKTIALNASVTAATGGIELIGGVTVNNKAITIGGRNVSSETQEFLRNVSGNNTWNGNLTITNSGGGYYIRSNAGKLTLGGTLTNAVAASTRSFGLKGPGEFEISGTLANGAGTTALQVGENANDAGLFATLTGNNSLTGAINIAAGTTLQVGNGGSAGNLGNGVVANTGTLIFNYGTGGNLAASNNIAGAGNVIKKGLGEVYLSGAKTYTGTTEVQAGTLGYVNSLPPNFFPTMASSATLSLSNLEIRTDNSGYAFGIDGKLAIDGSVSVVLPVAAPVGNFDVFTYGSISGAGNLTSNYRNATFTGGATTAKVTVAAGTPLTWTGANGDGWNLADVNWKSAGGTPQNFFWADPVRFDDDGAAQPNVTLSGELRPASFTVAANSTDYVLGGTGTLSGPFALTKNGDAGVTLGTANSFSGGIVINKGVLLAGNSQALGANGQVITVANGGTLDVNGALNANRDYALTIAGSGFDGTVGAVTNTGIDHTNGFGSLTLSENATIGGSGRWDIRPSVAGTGLVDLNGKILTKVGDNIIGIVDGTMTNDGSISINQGVLSLSRMVVSGAGSIDANLGGTLRFENYTSGSFSKAIGINDGTVNLTGSNITVTGPVNLTGVANFIISNTRTMTVTQPVNGPGSLNFSQPGVGTAGVLVLQNDNTYAGATGIDGGTLRIGDRTATGKINLLPVTLVNGGTLQISRSDSMVFPNLIQGAGNVTIGSTGTVTAPEFDSLITLTGNNTFTGNVTVGSGGLKIASASALGTGIKTVTLTNGTAGLPQLYLDGSGGNITLPVDVSFVTSSNNPDKPAIGNLAGDNVVAGTITMTSGGGSTAISVFGGSLTLNGNVASNTSLRRLILGGTGGNGTINGTVSGLGANAAGLDKVGANTWTLTGPNDYSGTTVVTGGTLLVNGNQGSASGAVAVGDTATLGGTGTIGGTINAAAGSTVSPGVSIGTLTALGPATIAGSLAIEMNVGSSDMFAVGGTLDISAAALNVTVTGTPNQPAYVLASYGALVGNFASFSGVPAGYALNYNYNGLKQIALVASSGDYSAWVGTFPGFVDNAPGSDADHDGLTNQQEYAFGLNPTSGSSVSPITQQLSKSTGTFKYTRRQPGLTGLSYMYESSTTLNGWSPLTPVTETTNSGSPVEEITVTVPAALLANPKVFVRVKAN